MKTKLALFALLTAALPACADLDVGGLTANATELATIAFELDWTIEQSGPLIQGKQAQVLYDADRLTECRGQMQGGPAWAITGYYSLNGAAPESFPVAGLAAGGGNAEPIIQLSHPGDLAIWFHNTNRWGCSAYDSNFGTDFHFPVGDPTQPPPATSAAALVFSADWTVAQLGPLVRGGQAVIDYDPERLQDCRGESNGEPAWTITGSYSLNGAAPQDFHVAGLSPTGEVSRPTIDLDHPGELEIWFHNTNRWGCSAYDSSSGDHYRFTVE
jgi:hypothetical protein